MKTTEEKILEIATVIYPKCIDTVEKIAWQGQSLKDKNPATAASKMAVRYANELLHQVHTYSQLFGEERKNF